MIENEKRSNSDLKDDFGQIVNFHKKYMVLHDLIYTTTILYGNYWYEYLKPHTSILK